MIIHGCVRKYEKPQNPVTQWFESFKHPFPPVKLGNSWAIGVVPLGHSQVSANPRSATTDRAVCHNREPVTAPLSMLLPYAQMLNVDILTMILSVFFMVTSVTSVFS